MDPNPKWLRKAGLLLKNQGKNSCVSPSQVESTPVELRLEIRIGKYPKLQDPSLIQIVQLVPEAGCGFVITLSEANGSMSSIRNGCILCVYVERPTRV